jgi:hypothetical protein
MVSLTAPASGDAYADALASIAHAKAVAAIFEIMFPSPFEVGVDFTPGRERPE